MANNSLSPPPVSLKDKEAEVVHKLDEKRKTTLQRFPLLFTLMTTFGLVATFYGFEHLIDSIDVLANNPFILLFVGISTLALTGTLYKKLG
jgi:hypothetical protein